MTVLTRSRGRFSTARSAWTDIAKATGMLASDVLEKKHNSTHWRFVMKSRNPSGKQKSLFRARTRSEEFHGFVPRKIRKINVDFPKVLVHIGPCPRVDYISDKYDEKTRHYFHEFGEGAQLFAAESPMSNGKEMLIIIGNFKITEDGIEG